MKNLFFIAVILLSTIMANGSSSAQTQSVTFNIKLNEGNIKEVISQTWLNSIKPQVESALREKLVPDFVNSSIYITIPNPVVTVTANSVTFSISNFSFGGEYSLDGWFNPDVDVDFDLTVTAICTLNVAKQFVLGSVTVDVNGVHIDVSGLAGWLANTNEVENDIESQFGSGLIIPGLSGLVLSNTVFTATYPGTATAISASIGQITYATPYLNIPVTATFTINPAGGGQVLSKNKGDGELPENFSLAQNYPNPFNPSTSIEFALPQSSNVTLKIYNSLGQEVVTLVNHEMAAGFHTVSWNGRDNRNSQVSSGFYIYRLQAGNAVFSKKMTFVK